MNTSPTLTLLLASARSRISEPPTWEEVLKDVQKLRLGAAHSEAAVTAGLFTDSIYMGSTDHWPADITESLQQLGLYEKYSPTTLAGVLTHLSSRQIGGLTSTVKGTLLEIKVRDAMNDGSIPLVPGAKRAELAPNLNQPGWDVAHLTSQGEALAHVQVKATGDWQPIAHHLNRYPEFPVVVTTREGAQAALAHGVSGRHIIDSGVHVQDLTDHVAAHLDNLNFAHATHELVPEVAIATILLIAAVKLRNGRSRAETATWVKEQATSAGIANAAALGAQILTGTVALRPIAAIGARFTVERGRIARRTGATLRQIRVILDELANDCRARGYALPLPGGDG